MTNKLEKFNISTKIDATEMFFVGEERWAFQDSTRHKRENWKEQNSTTTTKIVYTGNEKQHLAILKFIINMKTK